MDEIEHVFPLPEVEQHKLDEVKDEIDSPPLRRLDRFVRSHAWKTMGLSLAAGILCGLLWARRS